MEKPYVFITRKVPEETVKPLEDIATVHMWSSEEEPVPPDVLLEEAKHADALYTMLSERIDDSLLEQADNLKVIANLAVGYDNIDISAATKRGIAVCNTPDILSDTTADLTFSLLMATARRIVEAAQYIKNDQWKNWSPLLMAGTDIHHKTIGIVGMGRIGSAVAKRATGFDMEILYHNRSRKREVEDQLGATYASFDQLIQKSDYVVCLAPLTDETRDMFNQETFSKMKSSAIFINASRGQVVDETALYEALSNQVIAAAGLDVFREEPIASDHPLLGLDNVVALPHIGSASLETRYGMANLASRNIAAVLSGRTPEAIVNDSVLTS
ncbi:2-hydroxyacid dehydrogenase [Texcoconibacillus texcoconensis]|uniref:Glyoxylate reductase n=1 Tax=Texcoconibacillus texcoconensis TaxID=1095777 RepID=A0A840QQG6_9BACI|nr:D-glycerate dehydrogenase [Texcoconibacillus texcoconensis]MBB5173547.1 glyoxylate reductase [Texcoconibacillus texcoconensis]